jgi:hypothetical protein
VGLLNSCGRNSVFVSSREKAGRERQVLGKAMIAPCKSVQYGFVTPSFVNFVKPDYAAERSWQQFGHGFSSLHLTIDSEVFARALSSIASVTARPAHHFMKLKYLHREDFSYVARGEVKGLKFMAGENI